MLRKHVAEILAALPGTATDIAERTGISYESVVIKLNKLTERQYTIVTKKVANSYGIPNARYFEKGNKEYIPQTTKEEMRAARRTELAAKRRLRIANDPPPRPPRVPRSIVEPEPVPFYIPAPHPLMALYG